MFTFLFIVSLICSIILFVFIFINPSIGIWFIASLIATIVFWLLMQMRKSIIQHEKEIADLRYRVKKLEETDTKKEITDLRYKMKKLEEAVAKKE